MSIHNTINGYKLWYEFNLNKTTYVSYARSWLYKTGQHSMILNTAMQSQIAKFMGPTWRPPGPCRPQMGPMLGPWTLLLGMINIDQKVGNTNPLKAAPYCKALTGIHSCKVTRCDCWCCVALVSIGIYVVGAISTKAPIIIFLTRCWVGCWVQITPIPYLCKKRIS